MTVTLTDSQWMRVKYTLESRGKYNWVLGYQYHDTQPERLGIFAVDGRGEYVPLDEIVQDLICSDYSEWMTWETFSIDQIGELKYPVRFRRELLNFIRMEFDRRYFVIMHEAFKEDPVVEEVADV